MKLKHIAGNTYVIETNMASIGIYIFEDRQCLLIDSGANQTMAEEIFKILSANDWKVYAIFNTHSHADHCGGNHYIQSKSRCKIYASAIEAAFIENPILIPYSIYSAYPLKLLSAKFLMPQPSMVTNIISPTMELINNSPFNILDLSGHSLAHLGIITPDQVLFAGDSLISKELLLSNPFLYLANPHKQLDTFELLKTMQIPYCFLSHGGLTENISALVDANYNLFLTITALILDIITVPAGLETVIHEVIIRQDLQVNRNHYFRLSAGLSAFLSYLCNNGQAKNFMENNTLYYQAVMQKI
ncbi:MAG: MBL fold metallo-hydrolase [Syntrophomonadaceae bacterium]|jgi:glyoxylase-like metal-dependent hydrolase (beta-lactamase superfamily II)